MLVTQRTKSLCDLVGIWSLRLLLTLTIVRCICFAGSLNLSSRSYHRLLKVARTIADIEESQQILTKNLAEAKEGVGGLQEEVSQLRANKAAKEQELSGLQNQLTMLQASLDEVNEQLSQMKEKNTTKGGTRV